MYIGRFAPSPTGPLHFGSLLAAAGSYLDARVHQGKWLVRMEDLDPPREVEGAAEEIIRTLEAFGFEWDDEILYQSSRREAYEKAIQSLNEQDLCYPCTCSRKQLIKDGHTGPFGIKYPGICRGKQTHSQVSDFNIRIRTHQKPIELHDRLQGHYSQQLESDIGDFQLKRRDGVYAYHLAVVIDDADQGITDIVRGYDLLDSTPRQIYLQQLLQLPTPRYLHLPMAVNKDQQKLSKQTHARAIDATGASTQLWHALNFLDQQPPVEILGDSIQTIWQWAFKHWNTRKIAKNSQKYYHEGCTA